MQEFTNKNTIESYNSDLVQTREIKDFLSKDTVDEILKVYNSLSNNLTTVLQKPARVAEFDFDKIEENESFLGYVVKQSDESDAVSYDELDPTSDVYSLVFDSVDITILSKLKPLIIKSLESHGISGVSEFRGISLHNLDGFLPVHCDGNNIINRHAGRKEFPLTEINQWAPEKIINNPDKHKCALQGMITLESDSKYYGTAVFDQWFPWSTYYMPNHTEETMPRKKKSRITFLKNDAPERFNESIRLYTGTDISESDWKKLSSDQDPECATLEKDQFYGLTLEKVAKFGKPGTLNFWDNKKYHMTMPWNPKYETRRIMIQFETWYQA